MRTKHWLAGLAAVALALPVAASPAAAAEPPGFRIDDGRLVESDGSPFVMRGVNHAHTWYTDRTESFAGISSLGANAVRTVLSSGHRWTRNDVDDVREVIELAKQARLVSVLEVHDTTGYGEEGAAASLAQAVEYWISVKPALDGQEDYVLLNIGNEPFGNDATANQRYVTDTISAIQTLRRAGFAHTIVVDAPNWGQDWQHIMRDNAQRIFDADPDANVLFSIHMYGVYAQGSTVRSYFDAFERAGLPLIVGEFGNTHSDGEVDEDTILAEAQARGIGWLGWSWSGNSGGVEYLDLTHDFDASSLTPWGERLFHGPDGIARTAQRAAVFAGTTPTPTPTPTTPTPTPTTPAPTPTPTPAEGCTAELAVIGSWSGGFQAEVRVTAGTAAIEGWSTSFTLPAGTTIQNLWGGSATGSAGEVTVVNAAWNGGLSAGQGASFGFIGAGPAPSGPVTCAAR
ncbi:cellulase family glycosylhydrolase [Cellulomonas bogoriensis]|uniref:Endoglucanase n=1 Tax=Cellulomonas bogoriensis 69B4 = DSM 16987 TaxID=1386082 RepID=A0A0A0BYA2_9CELL|nr:cellulase family glycosylhydrolase [Cellulomonas bogoriensis]KGM12901.1 beta-mannosidase [Cellulomonas bogoriensis 69B4 = DSM 16987]